MPKDMMIQWEEWGSSTTSSATISEAELESPSHRILETNE
jgi:hypothetical protein